MQQAAQIVQTNLRPYDLIGRYGGEEFLSIIPGANLEQATALSERMLRIVDETPVALRSSSIPISLSIGVSSALGENITSLDPLLRAADEALYEAKAEGRNCVRSQVCSNESSRELQTAGSH